jgi:uncharacterized protein GlcG (DUF336 family)
VNLSIDVARRVIEASKQRAKELRSPVSIAIVDSGGHLVLFERMMSPYGWATGNISIAKASTAVMFNQSTDAVAQWGAGIPGFASSMAEMSHGKFIMAAGGWPIRIGGATVGGIGVSGGNAPGRDDDIARAGLGALEAMAPAIPAQFPAQSPQFSVPPAQFSAPLPAPSAQGQQQQHSRPYMQPAPSYPSLPQVNNPPLASNSGPGQQQNIPANAPIAQDNQQHNLVGTNYLIPDQLQEEDASSDKTSTQSNDNGGQS